MLWNPFEHSDQENLRWSWLRAVEWGAWPAFLSQPLAPVAIIFFPWLYVFLFVLALNVLWATARYRFVSPAAAAWGPLFALLRWIACPGAAILLWLRGDRANAIAALVWPLAAGTVLSLPPTRIGRLQRIFMLRLGYTEDAIDKVWAAAQPNWAEAIARAVETESTTPPKRPH